MAPRFLGLTEDEVAFYDALEVNDSAVKVLGDEILRIIAQELVRTVRENVRAEMRVMIKRVLRRYGIRLTSRPEPPSLF